MQLEDEVGDDSKISSAPSYSPEEVFVCGRVHCQDFARSSYQGDLQRLLGTHKASTIRPNLNQVVDR
jgi:hypothetical protein